MGESGISPLGAKEGQSTHKMLISTLLLLLLFKKSTKKKRESNNSQLWLSLKSAHILAWELRFASYFLCWKPTQVCSWCVFVSVQWAPPKRLVLLSCRLLECPCNKKKNVSLYLHSAENERKKKLSFCLVQNPIHHLYLLIWFLYVSRYFPCASSERKKKIVHMGWLQLFSSDDVMKTAVNELWTLCIANKNKCEEVTSLWPLGWELHLREKADKVVGKEVAFDHFSPCQRTFIKGLLKSATR